MNPENNKQIPEKELESNPEYFRRIIGKDGYSGKCGNKIEESDRKKLKRTILNKELSSEMFNYLLEKLGRGMSQKNINKSCFNGDKDIEVYINREIERLKRFFGQK